MRAFAVFLVIGLVAGSTLAAEIKYPVSSIPENLQKDVNAVVRIDELTYRYVNQRSAVETSLFAVTIFKPGAADLAERGFYYDKLTRLASLRAAVYDGSGKLIRKYKMSDFKDQSSFDGMYSDVRAKSIDLSQPAYPYTVEYEYEREYKYLFHNSSMTFIPDEKIAVEHAQYTLIYPDALKPRYRQSNMDQAPVASKTSDGLNQLAWVMDKIAPISPEPVGPGFWQLVPVVQAAPTKFEFEGYVGSMETWDEFGKWIALLNNERKHLPEATQAKAKEIAAKYTTREEKVAALYHYLQSKTRYVSVQLGIGGFQPFDAADVDQTGYGDCKALSNYMITLLEAAGIKANYVLIRAGTYALPIAADFPSSQFNHAVVAVPNGADTLWLECTSQTNPFGYAGKFTGDRTALMITDNGAKIVNTPRYTEQVNTQHRTARVTLDATGNAVASVRTVYSGMQYQNDGLNQQLENKYDEQKKWILRNTSIPTFDLKKFSMKDHKARIPRADVDLELVLNRYATISGKRLFFMPNLMNRLSFVPERVAERKNKVILRSSYADVDTVEFSIPEDLYPEYLPAPVSFKSQFGNYEASISTDAGKVVYIRKITLYKGEYPAEAYAELIAFFKNVSKADNTKAVFLNKT